MRKQRFGSIMTCGIVALGTIVFSGRASAALMVNIGGTIAGGAVVGGTTFTDNEAGVDANLAVGVLDIGAFLNSVTTLFNVSGFSTSSGSPVASLSLTASLNIQPRAVLPINVTIFITDTDLTSPAPPLTLGQTTTLLSSVGGVTATAIAHGFFGDSNNPFDVDGDITTPASSQLKNGVAINAPGVSGSISGTTPYSLTTFINLDLVSTGSDPVQNLQLNANLSATGTQPPGIPEPSTVLTVSVGLLFASAAFLRKRFPR